MRRLQTFAALAAMILVVTACGDDDAATTTAAAPTTTAASSTTGASETTAASTTTSATSAASTTTTATATTAAGGGDATSAEGIAALLEVFEQTPLKLTYQIGPDDDSQTVALVQDPTSTPPLNAIHLVDDGARIIISADTLTICDPDGGCFQAPAGAAGDTILQGFLGPNLGGALTLASAGDFPGFDVETDTTTIAGRAGVCFTYEPTALVAGSDTELMRQCVDSELGFTLLLEAQETGGELENVWLLLDFDQPTTEDFEPTGPVTTIPSP